MDIRGCADGMRLDVDGRVSGRGAGNWLGRSTGAGNWLGLSPGDGTLAMGFSGLTGESGGCTTT